MRNAVLIALGLVAIAVIWVDAAVVQNGGAGDDAGDQPLKENRKTARKAFRAMSAKQREGAFMELMKKVKQLQEDLCKAKRSQLKQMAGDDAAPTCLAKLIQTKMNETLGEIIDNNPDLDREALEQAVADEESAAASRRRRAVGGGGASPTAQPASEDEDTVEDMEVDDEVMAKKLIKAVNNLGDGGLEAMMDDTANCQTCMRDGNCDMVLKMMEKKKSIVGKARKMIERGEKSCNGAEVVDVPPPTTAAAGK